MDAKDVKPGKWDNAPIRVLFDDGEYSVIWGEYDGTLALGVRWNNGEDGVIGYPKSAFGHPAWYVEPDFIAITIIQRILSMAIDKIEKPEYYNIDNIMIALKELTEKLVHPTKAQE